MARQRGKKIKMSRPKIGGEGSSIRHKDVVVCNVGQFFFPKGSGKTLHNNTTKREREKRKRTNERLLQHPLVTARHTDRGTHERAPEYTTDERHAKYARDFLANGFPGSCVCRVGR